MHIPFSKYAGCGNDFLFIDNRQKKFPYSAPLIKSLTDRKRGVGADGIICLEEGSKHPYRMRIFNADGSEAEMCGNGLRCMKLFLEELGISDPCIRIETYDRELEISKSALNVRAKMGDPKDLRTDIQIEGYSIDYIDTGVPHAVLFAEDIESIDLAKIGPYIRNHSVFSPRGTNVNFVKITAPNALEIRTYERGVEGETLACGSGATASALIYALKRNQESPIQVKTRSGDSLKIEFLKNHNQFSEVCQTGPASYIFQGTFSLHHYKDAYV